MIPSGKVGIHGGFFWCYNYFREILAFPNSSDYILVCQRSTVHKVFLNMSEFFHTKKENEAININKKMILYSLSKRWTGRRFSEIRLLLNSQISFELDS